MASSATVRVDKATSDLLLGPDWTMNMEICDSINSDPGLAKEVLKAVKKRLQHKSPRVQFLALTLLETMIKNCGDFIHFQVAERDILQEMVKIVKKKADMEVRDKILVLLDSWQEAFGGSGGKYPQYFWAYTDLKRSGVDFPNRPSDATLMFAPPTHQAAATRIPHVGHGMPIDLPMRLDQAMSSETANLSLSDLDRIRSVMELLNDMLKAVNPRDREAVEDEVIKDLVDQCRSNQKKILQMIDSTGDEELLRQGLALNDNLQSLLAKHDAIASGSPFPNEASESLPAAPTTISANSLEEDEEDDDEFAQLARRNTKTKQNSTETGAVAITPSSNSPSSTFKQNESTDPFHTYAAPWAQLPPPPPSRAQPQFHFRPEQQYLPQLTNYPPPPWEDAPSTNPNPFTQSNHMMQHDSFNPPAAAGVSRANASSRPPAAGASHKPFVPSYRLFEDLVDAKNPNGAVKAGSSSGEGMAYGRN